MSKQIKDLDFMGLAGECIRLAAGDAKASLLGQLTPEQKEALSANDDTGYANLEAWKEGRAAIVGS